MQIDIDARLIGIRYPMEVNLVGDAAQTLRALIPLLQRKEDRALARGDRGRASTAGGEILDERAHQSAEPDQPAAASSTSSARGCPTRCILTADSGSATNWWARHLRMRDGHGRRALAARWPRCARRSPTRWRRSSPTPTGR